MAKMSRFYVIGDKQTGIVMLVTDPLKATLVPLAAIQDYATKTGKTTDAVFGEVAAAVKKLIDPDRHIMPNPNQKTHDAVGAMIQTGSTITDAEFCFISELDIQDLGGYRGNFAPIEAVVSILSGYADSKLGVLNEVPLTGLE